MSLPGGKMAEYLQDASLLPVHVNTTRDGPDLAPRVCQLLLNRNMGKFELCRASFNPTATFNHFLLQYIN